MTDNYDFFNHLPKDDDGHIILKPVPSWSDYRNPDGTLVYSWPYTNKCPVCGAEAMVGNNCTACGDENHFAPCPQCGTVVNTGHFEKYNGVCLWCNEKNERERMEKEWLEKTKKQAQDKISVLADVENITDSELDKVLLSCVRGYVIDSWVVLKLLKKIWRLN